MEMARSEVYLATGLAVLSLATAICQFVLLGLLALPLAPIALFLIILGVIKAKDEAVSSQLQLPGLAILILAFALLLKLAVTTSSLAFQTAVHLQRPSQTAPTTGAWLLLTAGGLLPAGGMVLGLRCWTGWSFRRCFFWGIATYGVLPAALLLFAVLRNFFPVTT